MAVTQIDELYIINLGLFVLGEKKLSGLSGDSTKVVLANAIVTQAINEVYDLSEINWTFATTRATLTRYATDPAFGYDYQYQIPAGCRRIIAFVDEHGDEIEYQSKKEVYVYTDSNGKEHEVDVILTNETTCRIKYIRKRIDMSKAQAHFVKLCYLNVAKLLCEPITQEGFRAPANLEKLWDKAYKQAKAFNNSEDVETVGTRNKDKGNDDVLEAANAVNESGTSILIERI
jgi:hypothetical protein